MRPSHELISEGLSALDIAPPGGAIPKFTAYLEEIKKWRKAVSLTSLKTDRDIVVKHFLDSCLYLKVLRRGVLSVADVGSGAGFPGIPIKILRPEIKVFLIEPRKKKCAFLRHIVRTLSLRGVEVMEGRVEDTADLGVDAAVTRALFSTAEFIEKASHIVREGGTLVLSKGPAVKKELEGLDTKYTLAEIPLPFGDALRYLLVITRP